jgi:hypothetical protein
VLGVHVDRLGVHFAAAAVFEPGLEGVAVAALVGVPLVGVGAAGGAALQLVEVVDQRLVPVIGGPLSRAAEEVAVGDTGLRADAELQR